MAYKGLASIPQQKSYGIATRQDWGEIASQCKEHLIRLMSMKANVVIIAQERVFSPKEDDDGNVILSDIIKPKIGAALIPSLTGWLNPASDYVMQTYKRPRMVKEESVTKVQGKEVVDVMIRRGEGVEFCVRTAPHDIFMTKFRTTAALTGTLNMPECIVLGDTATGVHSPSGYEKIITLIKEGKL